MKGRLAAWVVAAVLVMGFSATNTFADNAGRKLGRGLANTLFGVAEIPIQVQRTLEQEGSGAAITYGVCKGIGHFFMREGVGIYEIITFPIPYPKYYEP